MKETNNKVSNIVKYIYIMIFTTTFGTNILTINLSGFNLSLFRILFLLFIIIYLSYFILIKQKVKILKNEKFYYVFPLFWLFYSILSMLWVKNHSSAIKDMYFLLLFFVFTFTFISELKDDNFLHIIKIIVISSLLHLIIGTYEILNNMLFFVDDVSQYIIFVKNGNAVSTFTNPNNLSFFLFFIICLSLLVILKEKNKYKNVFYFMIALWSCFILFSNFSRATILALLVFVFFIICTKLFVEKQFYKLFVLMSISLTILILFFNKNINIKSNSSEMTRVYLIEISLEILKKTHFFGTGIGNLKYYLLEYQMLETVHNWWIEVLATFGVIIFLLYLYLIIKLFIDNYRLYKTDKNLFSLFYMGSLVSLIIIVVGPSSIMDQEWFWIFKSLIIAHTIYMKNKRRKIKNVNKNI